MNAILLVKYVSNTPGIYNQANPCTAYSVLVLRVLQRLNMSVTITKYTPCPERSLDTLVALPKATLPC